MSDNLIPFNERTKEEQREIAIKGGIASGKARKRKKTLKEQLLLILEEENVQDNMAKALIKEAIKGNKAGSVTKAFEVIRDTIGEKEPERVINENSPINELIRSIEELKNEDK